MIQQIIDGFKEILKEFSIVDIGEVDESLVPAGSTAMQITGIVPVNPNIPDAELTVEFYGMSIADSDMDKKLINSLYSRLAARLGMLSPADICKACCCQAELWHLQSAVPPSGGEERIFRLQYKLIVQNFQN